MWPWVVRRIDIGEGFSRRLKNPLNRLLSRAVDLGDSVSSSCLARKAGYLPCCVAAETICDETCSKGLGKVTLPFRFTEARITEAPDCVAFEGRIKEKKVNWTYRAEIEDADLVNFVILARNPAVVAYLAERLGVGLFGKVARCALNLILHPMRRAAAGRPDSPSLCTRARHRG